MSRRVLVSACLCFALAGCEKVPLVENPGEFQAASPGINRAPQVDAGADVTLQWPSSELQLTAIGNDDGLPSSGRLRYTWTAQAGATFDNPMALTTVARFPAPGTYVLQLLADDGALQANDRLVVTVLPPVAENAPPVVDAGPDQSIDLPASLLLRGTASDDGASPSPPIVQWAVSSGPARASISSPDSLETSVSFAAPGTYELVLSVSDGEHTAADSVIVKVAAPFFPTPDISESDPDRGWTRVPPSEVGMDEEGLRQAEEYALAAGGSGMIVRHGRLVHSWGDIDQRYDIKSTTKSIGAIALALALDDERVRLHDLASTHLPTIGLPPDSNSADWRSRITLLQLATHTAGFEKTGAYGRLLFEPGTTWHYSDGGLNWLADILTTVYAQDLQQLLAARVWPVLGINERDDIQWRRPETGFRPEPRPNGIVHREFASGFVANINTLARVGLLYLRRGTWGTDTRVFSESFVDVVRTPRAELANVAVSEADDFPNANDVYGVLWWTNAMGALPDVPRDAFWAWGLGDSLIVVIPSLDIVIARAGPILGPSPAERVFGDNTWTGEYEVLAPFLNPVVQAVRD